MKRRRRSPTTRARPQPPLGLEGVEIAPRRKSGVYSETGSGLVTRLGSSAAGARADRVKPERPRAPKTAADVERADRRAGRSRAAAPRESARARARDVVEKGGDPDAASSTPAITRQARRTRRVRR